MRGTDERTEKLFSYVSCEARVPLEHPLRLIRAVADEALEALSPKFERLYARVGRPSIAPEKLLRALLLQAFYSVRSERQLMEQLDYNLLFRWFVGLSMDAPVWDASTFSKNRDRLLAGDMAQTFLAALVAQPRVAALMSSEHFSVDGTLIQAWASQKSFRPKGEDGVPPAPPASGGRNAEANWRGQPRSNETHASTTDPDARLARKADGQSSLLAYAGHVLMENRSGLVRVACLTHATGTAERDASLALVDRLRLTVRRRITLGADKNYDARAHVEGLRARRVTPHVARNDHRTKTGSRRRSSIDGRTTRHPGYGVSQVIRKRIEEVFGWIKQGAGLRHTRHRGLARVGWTFSLAAAAYNLIRLPRLLAAAAP
ncbi:IS5 family transposase [Roseomonas chloroacetimidivorans]|uniref:IS5 family transposase n=1 Tax=Roseomonas chloroacetimidivorans TaxID=1766656 RepID=UPI003C747D8C